MVVVGLQHVPAAVCRVKAPHVVGCGHVAGDDAAFAGCGAADGEIHLSDERMVGESGLGVSECRRAGQSVPDQLRFDLRAFYRDGLNELPPQLLQTARSFQLQLPFLRKYQNTDRMLRRPSSRGK